MRKNCLPDKYCKGKAIGRLLQPLALFTMTEEQRQPSESFQAVAILNEKYLSLRLTADIHSNLNLCVTYMTGQKIR